MTSPYDGMSAVIYARISTADKGQDVDIQLIACRQWCKDNGVKAMREYVDKESGASLADHDRPQYDSMLGYILRNQVSIILAWKDDRLSRNIADKQQLLDFAHSRHVVIRYVTDSVAPETLGGQLADYVGTWKASRELADDSIRIRAGMQKAMATGTKSGKPIGRAPVLINMDLVMQCAASGHSISATAKIMHMDHETLRRRLENLGRLDEFYATAGAVQTTRINGVVHVYSKTTMRENSAELNTSGEKA